MILAQVKIAKTDVGCVVLGIHRDSVGPKSTAIPPVAGLFESDAHEEKHQASHCRADENASMAPRPYSISDEPGREHVQTNLRQVCVAVRMSLFSDLYQAAHRYQHSQKPEPARQNIRMFPSVNEGSRAERDEEQRRHQNLYDRKALPRMRIKHRQSKWPHELAQVNDCCQSGITKSVHQR
jgi:hypothetical protein